MRRTKISGFKDLGTTATPVIDASVASYYKVQCPAGNLTATVKWLAPGESVDVEVIQDGGGGRSITWGSGGTATDQTVSAPVAGDLQPAVGPTATTIFRLTGTAVDLSTVKVTGRLV